MTRERMRWYVDIQETVQADTGRIVTQPPTIHDDDDYARKNGLPGIIADGMISTNWILGLLVDVFGPEAAGRGRLRTKYIAPIYEDQVVIACARMRDGDERRGRRVRLRASTSGARTTRASSSPSATPRRPRG